MSQESCKQLEELFLVDPVLKDYEVLFSELAALSDGIEPYGYTNVYQYLTEWFGRILSSQGEITLVNVIQACMDAPVFKSYLISEHGVFNPLEQTFSYFLGISINVRRVSKQSILRVDDVFDWVVLQCSKKSSRVSSSNENNHGRQVRYLN